MTSDMATDGLVILRHCSKLVFKAVETVYKILEMEKSETISDRSSKTSLSFKDPFYVK